MCAWVRASPAAPPLSSRDETERIADVLIIHTLMAGGDSMGVQSAVRELALAQHRAGVDVRLLVNGFWGDDALRADGVTIDETSAREIARQVRSLDGASTVLHGHTLWSPMTLLALGRALNPSLSMVLSPHGSLAPEALRSARTKKRLAWATGFGRAARRHDALVVTSEAERGDVQALLPGCRTALLPNAVAPPVDGDIGRGQRTRTVSYLGRLHPIKGVLELVESWRRVSATAPGWTLRLIGPVEDAAYLAALQAHATADPSITIEDPVYGTAKWAVLAQSAIVAVPSRSENFSMVAAEALLMRTPVLTTHGVPWPAIETENLGWRGPGDPESLAAMLRSALSASSETRAQMGARGRAFVLKHYGLDTIAQTSLELYKSVGARDGT